LRKCHPLCSCWRSRENASPCAPSNQPPKRSNRAYLAVGSQHATHRQSSGRAYGLGCPSPTIVCEASLASLQATARLKSRSKNFIIACRHIEPSPVRRKPGLLNGRRPSLVDTTSTDGEPSALSATHALLQPLPKPPEQARNSGGARYHMNPCGSQSAVIHYKEADGRVVLRRGGAAAPPCTWPVDHDRY
jgi:hypothetical protein